MTDSSKPRARRKPAPASAIAERGLAREIMRQIDAAQGDPDFMTSLARGMAVLSVFAQHGREVTMSQISAETGIPRAAVRRALYTLAKLGYVGEHGRGYVLLPRVLGIGGAYVASAPLAVAAQPVLDALRDAVHESCSLGVLDGDDVLYVARAETVRIMSIGLRSGSRLPAYCTSMGRILLASLPPDTLEGYLERNPLRPRTERTITHPTELLEVLAKVRREELSLTDQELEIGLRSIAVPIRNQAGRVLAAMNVSGHASRITAEDMQQRYLSPLLYAAEGIRMALA